MMPNYQAFIEALTRVEYGAVQCAAAVIIILFARAFPKITASKTYARIAPLLPLVLCILLGFIPGVHPAEMPFGVRILFGVLLGATLGWAYKFVKQSVGGQDDRLEQPPAGGIS
jgi:hypothetical protein